MLKGTIIMLKGKIIMVEDFERIYRRSLNLKAEVRQTYELTVSYHFDNSPEISREKILTFYNITFTSATYQARQSLPNATILKVNGTDYEMFKKNDLKYFSNNSVKKCISQSSFTDILINVCGRDYEWEVTIKFYFNRPDNITTKTVNIDAKSKESAMDKVLKQFPNIQEISAKVSK